MTFRRVMLIVLPFLAAVFVYMLLRHLYGTWLESFTTPGPEIPAEGLRESAGGEEMELAPGSFHGDSFNVNLVRKDRDGRIEMRFLADVVIHRRKDTCDITRPRIQFFTRSGEVITLSADYATAVTDGPLTDIANIKSGRLWGNVVLAHDRGTYDETSDDILVGMEELTFDDEMYELATDGAVVLASEDMDLTARKMRILLDRKTRRIDTMTFYEDILILLEPGDRLQMGLGKRPGTPAAPEPVEPPAPPAPAPATAASSQSPAAPPAPAGEQPPAVPPPEQAAPEEDAGGSLWRIDLAGNVDARQLAQRLLCDLLTLYNRTAQAAIEPGAPEGSPATEEAAAAGADPADVSASAPSQRTGPAGTAPSGAASPGTQPGPAANAPPAPPPPSGDPKYLQPGAPPPLVVIADGPLIVTPVPAEERKGLAGAENEVTAIGKPAVVEDGETRIVGREVHYNLKNGSGLVVGTPGERILEQPDRMWLTGGRLTFDRTRGTADVAGEGKLHARVATESLTGAAAAGGPKPEPSALDARWARSMHLEFYELPEGGTGAGQLRRAAFSGQAEVVQKDGLLRGDELVIDFFPAADGQGQAVERLVGHGDVFVKNTRPSNTVAGAQNVGDITAQDLDMSFARGAGGDGSEPKRLKAAGKVLIHDVKGTIRAEDLLVTFGRNAKGELEAEFLDATGNVLIDRSDMVAEGDHVKRDLTNGILLLEGKPARAARGGSRIVGPYIEFVEKEGLADVRGAGELEMPATTDLRGQPRQTAEPLVIRWARRMHFEDKRNFAFFESDVKAATGGSRLDCRRLWVYFREAPEQPVAGAEAPKQQAPGELGGLLGRKAIERVFAEEDVLAAERRMDPDGCVRYQMEIAGTNLTYLAENRKAYIRGPGRMRILSRENPEKGRPQPGLKPEAEKEFWADPVPAGHSRTLVAWTEGMAYDGPSDRAYFKGNVESIHTGRGVPGETGAPSREAATTKIRSSDLQVAFSERAPSVSGAAAPREERMGVEKMSADGGVQLWVDDRRGSARRLMYQRQPELLRLYSGPDQWARLWQANEALQEFGEVKARVITYYPSSKRVDMVDQQEMVVTPR
ncbi:MAG TPA: hypothetical protein VMY35_04215 [Phycisphaerae bacterium]|nr:hypothetical protein [Phycisphaerae bacterium]